MKKILLFSFFVLSSFSILTAQNKTSQLFVQYNMYLNFKGNVRYDADLILNSNYSLFKYKVDDSQSRYKEEIIDADSKVNIKIIDSSYSFVFIDKINKTLLEEKKTVYSKKTFKVKELIPTISWVLTEEIKSINNLSCKKATASFRGRKYTVWYCPSIPTNCGPWKLNGLPGLIVEATDEEKQVAFYLKKIVSPFNQEIKLNNSNSEKDYSYEEFLKLQKEDQDDFESKMASKFDRGMNIKVDFKYDGIER